MPVSILATNLQQPNQRKQKFKRMALHLAILMFMLALSGNPVAGEARSPDLENLAGVGFDGILSMEQAETSERDAVISLRELITEKNIPKQARKLYRKGLKSERKGHLKVALEQMQASVDVAPDFFQAHAALAVGYLKQGKLDQAMREAEASLKLNPYYLPAYEIKGVILFFQSKLRQAAATLDEVVRNAPRRRAAQYFLGTALLRLGNSVGARYHLERAEALSRETRYSFPRLPSLWDNPSSFARPESSRKR